VAEQHVPYVRPQENGNKTETRWSTLRDSSGAGLLVLGGGQFDFSAHHYTPHDLTAANHTYEVPQRSEVYLTFDLAQGGLGNGSCGPGVLPQYILQPGASRFELLFRPLKAGQAPESAAKTSLG
jgi:beta-galactosidase